MRAGYDAKRAFRNLSGLGGYSRTLLEDLALYVPEVEQVLFTPGAAGGWPPPPGSRVIRRAGPGAALWRRFGLAGEARGAGVQIFHGLSNELPAGLRRAGIRSVATVHDVIFRIHPEQYRPADRALYHWKTRQACRDADLILAISEATRRDLLAHYRVPEDRVRVQYQAVAPPFRRMPEAAEMQEFVRKHQLPAGFVLYVGAISPRKNLLTLLDALERMPDPPPLVIVGRGSGPYARQAAQRLAAWPARKLHAQRLGPGPAELPLLYRAAALLAYPSRYEGFGLPVLEALHADLPVLTSPQASMPEAGGEAAWYADPLDPDALAHAIGQILGDSALREARIRAGRIHRARFSPEQLARQVHAAYASLL
ncbi:MAG: glycosyltransferase family 1 protein [Bacteroidia bacterium]|nr:glycosyltransferase family 1 protein [Bacteroidia bacterium]